MIGEKQQRALAQIHGCDLSLEGLGAPHHRAAQLIAVELEIRLDIGRPHVEIHKARSLVEHAVKTQASSAAVSRAPCSRTTSTNRSTSPSDVLQLTSAGRNATRPPYVVVPT